MHTIGIDFGTTKTLVSHINPRTGQPEPLRLGRETHLLPTTIYIDANGHYYYGDDADDMIEEATGCYIRGFKMKLGSDAPMHLLPDGSRIFARDLVREYLHFIRKKVEKLVYHGEQITKATITRPVKFSPAQCMELEQAAKAAGFQQVEFTTEPEAAGLAYCRLNASHAFTRNALVVDWGGGTLDFALVTRHEGTVRTHANLTDGDTSMGGEKFDNLLWNYVEQAAMRLNVDYLDYVTQLPRVRRAKEVLSTQQNFTLRLSYSLGACPPISLTSRKFNKLIQEDVQRASQRMQELMRRIPVELKPEMILLVGGSSQIPLIQEKLKKAGKLPVHVWNLSREAVSLGASLVIMPDREETTSESPSSESGSSPDKEAAPEVREPVNKNTTFGGVLIAVSMIILIVVCLQPQNKIADEPEAKPVPASEAPLDAEDLFSRGGQLYDNKQHHDAVAYFRKAAEQGDARAQCKLGWCYEQGQGVTQDCQQAVTWYRKAAEQGYAMAQCNLGICYEKGQGVAQDYQQAASWYQKAADQGYAMAQCNLGGCYVLGQGVAQDYQQAAGWYQKAADQGYAIAQRNLGICYENGQGVAQDYQQAASWYQKAAEQGYGEAQCNLGICYENGQGVAQDYQQAADWYQKAADQGHARAQCILGWFYEQGRGVTQDCQQAVVWYRKAAEQGETGAQCILGTCYEQGQGVAQDYQQAVAWYQKAAEQGYDMAQCNLGLCYEQGRGVTQDYQQAADWYQKAADQGYENAQRALDELDSKCVIEGKRLYKKGNYKEAAELFELAARIGNTEAEYRLGRCYEYGRGKEKNLGLARNWYSKSVKKNHAASELAMARLLDKIHKISSGIRRDHEAEDYAIRAFLHGKTEALEMLGRLLRPAQMQAGDAYKAYDAYQEHYRNHQDRLALNKLQDAADLGHSNAQFTLAMSYLNLNPDFAFKYLCYSAAQDNPAALTQLGKMFEKGIPPCKKNKKMSGYLNKRVNREQ